MDLKVTGDPGQGNTYIETHVQDVGSYNPNALEVKHYHYECSTESRMGSYFRRLLSEIEQHSTAKIVEELKDYTTKLDGTKSMEEKLSDGGFRRMFIKEAIHAKDLFAKKSQLYSFYPSAQQIFLYLFAKIKHEFYTSVFPLIEDREPTRKVMERVREKIVTPIMQEIDSHGANDRFLLLTDDHIYGMIYFLTQMCHLNWKDYDYL